MSDLPDFQSMTNDEVGQFIINGVPGSRASLAAIDELVGRLKRLRAEASEFEENLKVIRTVKTLLDAQPPENGGKELT